jgi:MFS family permease
MKPAVNLLSKSKSSIEDYLNHLRAFTPNARLYLISVIVMGVALGIFRLLFNFYALSLGYDEAVLGRFVTVNNLTALLAALPIGYFADQFGRKKALITASLLSSTAILSMVLVPVTGILFGANVLFGVAQSLAAITMAPFLMENSGEKERTYLFSFSFGLQMAAGFVGSWVGGYLPKWMAGIRGVEITSSEAYAGSLLVVGLIMASGIIPLSFLKTHPMLRSERSVFAPLDYARRKPTFLGKLILPMLVTSIGAGFIMPFMNVFFRQVHLRPDYVIGTLFAWGSLAMAIGLMIAPPIAERMGKIQLVVITRSLSIPFLIMLGFSPWFWMSAAAYFVRLALMNMSGPVYQTFVMEQVEASARATVASLVSMAWNFGWVFSPMISGWLQVNYGFGPVFMCTIALYLVGIIMIWAFFWKQSPSAKPVPVPGD